MYDYEALRENVFTPEGYRKINQIKKNIADRDVFTVDEAIKGFCGDSWTMLACLDWLVENGELKYVTKNGARQHWIMKKC